MEEERKGESVRYEAHVKKGDAAIAIVVDPNGVLIGKHREKGEK